MQDLLRCTIQLIVEEWYLEQYGKNIIDDESFQKQSIIVNDDAKKKIKHWLQAMKLS